MSRSTGLDFDLAWFSSERLCIIRLHGALYTLCLKNAPNLANSCFDKHGTSLIIFLVLSILLSICF